MAYPVPGLGGQLILATVQFEILEQMFGDYHKCNGPFSRVHCLEEALSIPYREVADIRVRIVGLCIFSPLIGSSQMIKYGPSTYNSAILAVLVS